MIQAAGVVAAGRAARSFSHPNADLLRTAARPPFRFFRTKVSRSPAPARIRKGRFTQFYSVTVTPETWERDLGHARTFCFFEEIEYLIKNGLIKGGSLENAVVIRDDAILTTEPLRYPGGICAAQNSGHHRRPFAGGRADCRPRHRRQAGARANCELARQISLQMRKPLEAAQSFAPPPPRRGQPGRRSAMELQRRRRIGHGAPDEDPAASLSLFDGGQNHEDRRRTKSSASRTSPPTSLIFRGIFPTIPSCRACCNWKPSRRWPGIMMLRQAENFGKLAYFMSAESVRWRKPVRPGDTLVIYGGVDQVPRQNRQGQGRLLGQRRNGERGGSDFHAI